MSSASIRRSQTVPPGLEASLLLRFARNEDEWRRVLHDQASVDLIYSQTPQSLADYINSLRQVIRPEPVQQVLANISEDANDMQLRRESALLFFRTYIDRMLNAYLLFLAFNANHDIPAAVARQFSAQPDDPRAQGLPIAFWVDRLNQLDDNDFRASFWRALPIAASYLYIAIIQRIERIRLAVTAVVPTLANYYDGLIRAVGTIVNEFLAQFGSQFAPSRDRPGTLRYDQIIDSGDASAAENKAEWESCFRCFAYVRFLANGQLDRGQAGQATLPASRRRLLAASQISVLEFYRPGAAGVTPEQARQFDVPLVRENALQAYIYCEETLNTTETNLWSMALNALPATAERAFWTRAPMPPPFSFAFLEYLIGLPFLGPNLRPLAYNRVLGQTFVFPFTGVPFAEQNREEELRRRQLPLNQQLATRLDNMCNVPADLVTMVGVESSSGLQHLTELQEFLLERSRTAGQENSRQLASDMTRYFDLTHQAYWVGPQLLYLSSREMKARAQCAGALATRLLINVFLLPDRPAFREALEAFRLQRQPLFQFYPVQLSVESERALSVKTAAPVSRLDFNFETKNPATGAIEPHRIDGFWQFMAIDPRMLEQIFRDFIAPHHIDPLSEAQWNSTNFPVARRVFAAGSSLVQTSPEAYLFFSRVSNGEFFFNEQMIVPNPGSRFVLILDRLLIPYTYFSQQPGLGILEQPQYQQALAEGAILPVYAPVDVFTIYPTLRNNAFIRISQSAPTPPTSTDSTGTIEAVADTFIDLTEVPEEGEEGRDPLSEFIDMNNINRPLVGTINQNINAQTVPGQYVMGMDEIRRLRDLMKDILGNHWWSKNLDIRFRNAFSSVNVGGTTRTVTWTGSEGESKNPKFGNVRAILNDVQVDWIQGARQYVNANLLPPGSSASPEARNAGLRFIELVRNITPATPAQEQAIEQRQAQRRQAVGVREQANLLHDFSPASTRTRG